MSRKKDIHMLVSGAGLIGSSAEWLAFGLMERGDITPEEIHAVFAGTNGRACREELGRIFAADAATVIRWSRRRLKKLSLVEERIDVNVPSFSRDDFFGGQLGIPFLVSDSFKELILPHVSMIVPAYCERFGAYHLSDDMTPAEIQREIGEPHMGTPDELVASLVGLMSKQPNGKPGRLQKEVWNNFLILLPDGSVVAVYAYGYADCHGWFLDVNRLDVDYWYAGDRVFSRS